jgi:hypothetical protein
MTASVSGFRPSEVSRARMMAARFTHLTLRFPVFVNFSSSCRSSGLNSILRLVLVIVVFLPPEYYHVFFNLYKG